VAFGLTYKSQRKLSEMFAELKGGTVEEYEKMWDEINRREVARIARNDLNERD